MRSPFRISPAAAASPATGASCSPELTASATRNEAAEVTAGQHDGHFSSSRTCEIGMTRATGQIYRSYLYLLEQATRP